MTCPKISVIIPCRNERRHVAAALQSALDQAGFSGPIEVIVADGMSDDGTRGILAEIAGRDGRVRIIDNPARIVAAGLNTAISAAKGEIIVRMDVHTAYAPDYISQCLRALAETGADNVGGPALTRAETYFQKANALAYHSPFSVGGARFHDPGYAGWVDTVTYGCWRRETFEKYGLFDEELVRNQDDEHNLRIIRGGGKIWQSPLIRSWYFPRSTPGGLFRQYMQYGYWKVRVIQKHRLPASVRHLVPGGFIAVLIVTGIPAVFSGWARALFSGLIGAYAAANLIASVTICRRPRDWRYFPVMPLVFGAYHFGYGWGFLRGIIDFFILSSRRRRPFSTLTR